MVLPWSQMKQNSDDIFLSQSKFAKDLVTMFRLQESKPANTPISTSEKITKDFDRAKVDSTYYRSIIESLLYLTTRRPNISFSVGACARYKVALKNHILRQLRGSSILSMGLQSLDYGTHLTPHLQQYGTQMLIGLVMVRIAKVRVEVASTQETILFLAQSPPSSQKPKEDHLELETVGHLYNRDHLDKPLQLESTSSIDEDEALQAKDDFDIPGYQFQENPRSEDEEEVSGVMGVAFKMMRFKRKSREIRKMWMVRVPMMERMKMEMMRTMWMTLNIRDEDGYLGH